MSILSERYKAYAIAQGETEELLQSKIHEFRIKVDNMDIKIADNDLNDANIIRFLRARKMDVDYAVQTFMKWTHFHHDHPTWFHELHSKEFERYSALYRVLPEPDSHGRVICVFQAKYCMKIFTPEYLKSNPLALIRGHMWFTERISQDPRVQLCGVVAILSFRDLTMRDHLRLAQIIKISEQVSLIRYLQDCIGLQLHHVSFFDEPRFIKYIWYLIKPILVDSMKMKVSFNGTFYAKLDEMIPGYDGCGLDTWCDYDWVAQQISYDDSHHHISLSTSSSDEI